MEGPANSKPSEGQNCPRLLILLLIIGCNPSACESNPYYPVEYTWEVTRTLDGQSIAKNIARDQPHLKLDLCKIFRKTLRKPENNAEYISPVAYGAYHAGTGYGCGTKELEQGLWRTQHYICPMEGPPHCGDQSDYYCAQWGRESLALWKEADSLLKFHREVRTRAQLPVVPVRLGTVTQS